jgi:hypothetical protein
MQAGKPLSNNTRAKQTLRRFWRDRRGNITPMFALLLVPLIGMLGMAGEGSSWYLAQRAAQNAADQAAMAAAANGCQAGCPTTYSQEAAGVSQKYNFVNGVNDTSVVADITGTPSAPCASSTCYRVTIQRNVPVMLLRLVGYSGSTVTAGGDAATNIFARAIATRGKSDAEFCITTLSSSSTSFEANGTPSLDLSTCPVFAPNGGTSCTNQAGDKVLASYVGSTGKTNDNCGIEQPTSLTPLDPFGPLTSNLPDADTTCAKTYYRDGDKKNPLPTTNILTSGTYTLASKKCGDVRLDSDVTVNGVLLIENGHLDLNGHKLTGTNLTIIFSGPAGDTKYEHFICSSSITPSNCTSNQSGGVLDFAAPTSGTWSGVAIYQDPRLGSGKGVNMIDNGNSPQWDITGMIYAPKADFTLSGAINHATSGYACLSFFVNSMLVNGGGSIFATPTKECKQAGIDPNSVQTLQKVVMVQ